MIENRPQERSQQSRSGSVSAERVPGSRREAGWQRLPSGRWKRLPPGDPARLRGCYRQWPIGSPRRGDTDRKRVDGWATGPPRAVSAWRRPRRVDCGLGPTRGPSCDPAILPGASSAAQGEAPRRPRSAGAPSCQAERPLCAAGAGGGRAGPHGPTADQAEGSACPGRPAWSQVGLGGAGKARVARAPGREQAGGGAAAWHGLIRGGDTAGCSPLPQPQVPGG